MFIQYIATDPELIPGFYVDSPINGLTGPFDDEESAEDFVNWSNEPHPNHPPKSETLEWAQS